MTTKNSNVVSFRNSEIKEKLLSRDISAGGIAERDLDRYYSAIEESLRKADLTRNEALFLCDIFNGTLFCVEISAKSQLINQVKDASEYAEKHKINFDELIAKIGSLTDFDSLAIFDGIERFWHEKESYTVADVGAKLVEVGLTSKQSKESQTVEYRLTIEEGEKERELESLIRDFIVREKLEVRFSKESN